ncbi:hypothetical protein GLOTRDRAFT_132530 [Gloeophyllum trabeum ATCC 11539]|uniref:Uncharacterized protein n=1 Tax=Gloeophyllum trabeum (strain ATCC 11539 / FP-39264 / Madison 617) TaxID=670483 RepID=S7RBT2_GLOTA|nr:uncharacterized protein GLOTRDRAFT_132530 [Gloeophyllum trabeum ATCC 11539]EPQ51710.1 hypothetical protein GLOTRDRAFT_132530 [Gloeophyllum trabeum ATCC 11539]
MDRRSLPSDPQTPVISPGDTQDHLENDCGLYLPDDLPSARFNNLLGSLPALENDNTRGHLHSCDSLGQDATITGPDRSILSGLQGSFQSHLYDLSEEDTPFSVQYGPRSYRPDAQGGSPVEPGTVLSLENLDPWGAFYDPDALARNTGMMRPDPSLFLDPSYSVQHYLHNAPEEYQSEISTSSSPVQYRLQPYLPDAGGAGPAQRSARPSYGRYTCQFYFEDEAAGQQGDLMSPATVHSDSDRSSFPGSTPDAAWRLY